MNALRADGAVPSRHREISAASYLHPRVRTGISSPGDPVQLGITGLDDLRLRCQKATLQAKAANGLKEGVADGFF